MEEGEGVTERSVIEKDLGAMHAGSMETCRLFKMGVARANIPVHIMHMTCTTIGGGSF